jgi:hypothetical protein
MKTHQTSRRAGAQGVPETVQALAGTGGRQTCPATRRKLPPMICS